MAPKAIKPDIEGYAFYFFSNENNEPMHVRKGDGLVKYWLEPVSLADDNGRMKVQEVRRSEELVKANRARIVKAWNEYFKA